MMCVHTVGRLRGSQFSHCMHDHKTCMNFIVLETYYPPICESGWKMANGFEFWKGEGRRKGENKGKTTLHVCAEALK